VIFIDSKRRADQDTAFTGTIMHEKSQQILRHVLESSSKKERSFFEIISSTDELIFNKAKDAYDACMDEAELKTLGSKPLIELLHVIEEIFPAATPDEVSSIPRSPLQYQKPLRAKKDSNDRLTKIITYFEKIDVTALVSFGISVCIICRNRYSRTLTPIFRLMIKIQTLLFSS
jgi:hypothetical protein